MTVRGPLPALLLLLLLGLFPGLVAAQQVHLPENDGTLYIGPEFAPLTGAGSAILQRYRVYLPSGQPPCAGWPVLVHLDLTAFALTVDYPTIDPDGPLRYARFFDLVLRNGIAVITATATPTGNVPGGVWSPSAVQYPTLGRFHPPGQTACFQYADLHPTAELDAILLLQHVRHHAGDPTSPYAAHMQSLDRTRVALHGASGGAVTWMWVAFGPDRRDVFDGLPGWGGQYDEPTRPDAVILREGGVSWPALQTTTIGRHFSNGACNTAPTLASVDLATQQQASPLWYGQGVAALNDSLPTFLYYNVPFSQASCLGQPPGCTLDNGTLLDWHSAWHGLIWWDQHPQTRLALTNDFYQQAVDALAPVHGFDPLDPPDTLLEIDPGSDVTNAPNADMVAFLREHFGLPPHNPWTTCWTLFRPGAGMAPPQFGPSGTLGPGGSVLLPVTAAPPGRDVEIRVAAWPTALVDTGCGQLIERPELIIPLMADERGRSTYALSTGELPGRRANIFQVVVDDPGEPCGFSISATWISDAALGGH